MILCDNSDHDGARVEALTRIQIGGEAGVHADRCLYCAEGLITSLIRQRRAFTSTPHEAWRVLPVDARAL